MTIIGERAYLCALKEEYLSVYCSTCFREATRRCSSCGTTVYCDERCELADRHVHRRECGLYRRRRDDDASEELVLVRLLSRLIGQVEVDGGEPKGELCDNVPSSIRRRCWKDLLSHRDEILQSDRHRTLWLKTKGLFERHLPEEASTIDLLEIFGKLLINRFRVGVHRSVLQGRIAIGWAIYLTISGLNHACQPDLHQCSFDLQMRLKSAKEIPAETSSFYSLTVSYRHQNDFRPFNSISYVPRRSERRSFLQFFFFRCHCSFCADESRFEREEYLSNQRCSTCGECLHLRSNSSLVDGHRWVFVCSNGRCAAALTHRIHRSISLDIEPNETESVEIEEKNFSEYEKIFHRHSLMLVRRKEHLLHRYSTLDDRRSVERRIELGEELKEFYDRYFSSSTNYPKIFVQDLAFLHQSIGETTRARQILDEAKQLWLNDYEGHLNLDLLHL